MIHKCDNCGAGTYHACDSDPRCWRCRLKASEVAPIPGQFRARFRTDADPDALAKVKEDHGLTVVPRPGDEVGVVLCVHVRVEGDFNGSKGASTYQFSLDEARDFLEPFEQELVDLRSFVPGRVVPGKVELTGEVKNFMAFPRIKTEEMVEAIDKLSDPFEELVPKLKRLKTGWTVEDSGERLCEAIGDANREIMESSGKANVECTLTDYWRMKYLDAAGRVARLMQDIRQLKVELRESLAVEVVREERAVGECVPGRVEVTGELKSLKVFPRTTDEQEKEQIAKVRLERARKECTNCLMIYDGISPGCGGCESGEVRKELEVNSEVVGCGTGLPSGSRIMFMDYRYGDDRSMCPDCLSQQDVAQNYDGKWVCHRNEAKSNKET